LKLGEELRKHSKPSAQLRLVFLINNYDLIVTSLEVNKGVQAGHTR
jgi:hypothetical protein